MQYFGDTTIDEENKRNAIFTAMNALREGITIARRSPQHLSYERVFDVIYELDPLLYEQAISLLTQKNESDTVKLYKEMANAKKADPVSLIEDAILTYETLLRQSDSETTFIKKKIFELEFAKEYFNPRKVSENQILNSDFTLAGRNSFFEKTLYENEQRKDYKLTDNRILRIRLAHPDKYEQIIGSDMIYEQFDLRDNTVRFVHLQYKTWNSKILYFSSSSNLIPQINKLSKNICGSGFCKEEEEEGNFRFPFCSAFLRPTSYILKPDSKLVSTGEHIPVCKVKELEKEGKITFDGMKKNSVGHKIFEELFIRNSLGSKKIYIETLEKFYSDKGLLSNLENIRVHLCEVICESESEKNQRYSR